MPNPVALRKEGAAPANVAHLIDRITEVCPLPSSVQRILALTSDDSTDIKEVVQAVAVDPALASEVLRLANSAAFGVSRKVSDLRQAVTTLGFRELNSMAAAMALLATFRSQQELSLHLHDYSVLCGALARKVSAEIGGVDQRSAFLCGLLSEIGAMACLAVDTEAYVGIWKQSLKSSQVPELLDWEERARMEIERYGAASTDIGARLLRRNLLPDHIVNGVGASLLSDISKMDRLDKVTAFSRVASLVTVRAGAAMDVNLLQEAIPPLQERLQLAIVPTDKLIQACVDAGGTAEYWLKKSR